MIHLAIELGQAYVQIMPSARGISDSIKKELDPESEAAGTSAGGKIASALKGAITVAAIGKFIGTALTEGADLQQSLGGIETLYKESADKMKGYANEAYRTTGLSANDYMESVTSFSASLLQSMGGDTENAADKANMAMIDMSDNANKMGTDMESIQNAYMGFAKQNYTMLDNLKLGYGGTKSEMSRLLKDAQELTGVQYNIENLSDVYDAIHAIQENLDITGTTAKESAETFSGSLASMKSAFSNFMGNLSLGNDLGPSLTALGETVSTFLFGNLIPMVIDVVSALPGAIMTFITSAGPNLLSSGTELIKQIATGITAGIPVFLQKTQELLGQFNVWLAEQFPALLEKGVEFITNFANGFLNGTPGVLGNVGTILSSILEAIMLALPALMESGYQLISNLAIGIWNNLPAVVEKITGIISSLLSTILEKYPDILRRGFELVGNLAMGIWNNLPEIITTIGNLLLKIISTIGEYFPQFISKGFELLIELGNGIVNALPEIVAKVPEIVNALITKFGELSASFFDIGKNVVEGLWSGILSVKDWLLSKISGFVDSVLGGIKDFFGIHSPSRRMADEVGQYLPAGLAMGIEDNTKPVTKAMESLTDLTTGSLVSDLMLNQSQSYGSGTFSSDYNKPITMDDILSLMNNQMVEAHFHIGEQEIISAIAPGMSRALERMNQVESRSLGVINP